MFLNPFPVPALPHPHDRVRRQTPRVSHVYHRGVGPGLLSLSRGFSVRPIVFRPTATPRMPSGFRPL